MHKIIINNTPGGSILNIKLDNSQQLNIREIELLNSKNLGFALPFTCSQTKNSRLISYNITGKITLKQYLKAITNKQKFFDVIASFIKAIKGCDENKLFIKNVLFDFNYIFVDGVTKQIRFIYIPIIELQNIVNISIALKEIAFSSVFGRTENNDYVKKYINYFKDSNKFSLVEFEGFTKNLSDGLYKEIKTVGIQNEVSATNEQNSKSCDKCGVPISSKAKSCAKCGKDVLIPIQKEETKKQNDFVFMPIINPINTVTKSETASTTSSPAVATVSKKLATEDFDGTTVLGEDNAFGTSVLTPEELNTPAYSYLIRIKSGERISINKPVFRIGKEKSYVDYFISDNGAVSRSHADIITKDVEYFILDHNSTNKTYINGEAIRPNIEIKIINGMKIRLSNEEFEFYAI